MSAGFSEITMLNLILSMIIGVPILCAMFGQGIDKDIVTLMIERVAQGRKIHSCSRSECVYGGAVRPRHR